MRRTVLEQAVVVGVGSLAPAVIGVVAGLRRQDRLAIVVEGNFAIIIGDRFVWFHARRLTPSGEAARIGTVDGVTSSPPGPSPYSPQGSDEQIWRRPVSGAGQPPPPPVAPSAPAYSGPPPTIPPRAGWRPRLLMQVPEARTLPAQDDAVLDEQERSARTITYGVGMMAGAIALIVLFVICGRVLF
jgi:hypothetical protein